MRITPEFLKSIDCKYKRTDHSGIQYFEKERIEIRWHEKVIAVKPKFCSCKLIQRATVTETELKNFFRFMNGS